ncbi:MAG: flagellar basal body P-ring formation chaperone FlgA [Pseudomonadaceae bacterium]|nr:flagellar basal body P-ring formation chaperone FlgA [Pseudomonadaceae bacterium]
MKIRTLQKSALTLALLCTYLFHSAVATASVIEEQVSVALEAQLAETYPLGNYEYSVLPVRSALHLKPCDSFATEIKTKVLVGRVPVHVRCLGPANWSLYASAEVKVAIKVITTRRAISRGEMILAGDLAVKTQWLQQSRRNHIADIDAAVGKVARRALRADMVLNSNHLEAPMAVDKGERVRIIANSGRVSITSYGTAMGSGRIGEQIQVRNDSSARIIRPWVIGPGKVGTSAPDFKG